MTDKTKKNLWDRMARSFHDTSVHSKAHKDKYSYIAKLIINHNPETILDLGCGSGILEKALYDLGYQNEIMALDSSTEMLKIAERIVGNEKCKFQQRDLENKFCSKKNFDVVVSINLFFFLKDKNRFLENVSDSLRSEDSLFIMVTPKPEDDSSNWRFVIEHFEGTTFLQKILISLNELFIFPRYIDLAIRQKQITRMARRGEIKYDSLEDIKLMAKSANLDIIKTEDIHAKQNWMFVMRRG